MKAFRLAVLTAVAASVLSVRTFAQVPTHTFYIFKISASIPVTIVTDGVAPNFIDKVTTKTLKTNDIANLALGQPTSTKLSSDIFLGMALAFEDLGQPVLSKMIVCDKSQTGPALVKAVVATLDTLDFRAAYLGARRKGSGYGTGQFVATTLGDPSKWAILQSPFTGSGLSAGPLQKVSFTNPIPVVSPVATASLAGRMKFRTTDSNNVTTTYEGIFARSSFKLTGKIIATFDQ